MPSQRRRSPGIGTGTSVDQGTLTWRRPWNAESSATCGASRSGFPPGNVRTERSSPTTAATRASRSTLTFRTSARSSRLSVAAEHAKATATVRNERPQFCRANLISRPRAARIRRLVSAPRSVRLSRVPTARSWSGALYWHSSGTALELYARRPGAPVPRRPAGPPARCPGGPAARISRALLPGYLPMIERDPTRVSLRLDSKSSSSGEVCRWDINR
jgi:hypothetical protein